MHKILLSKAHNFKRPPLLTLKYTNYSNTDTPLMAFSNFMHQLKYVGGY